MILVGNQRGGASDLARHLTKSENERVELHEVRGFVASDLLGAFRESYAISRSTQCRQHLFSLSLSPPKGESVSNAAFEKAIQQAEERLGLNGQPRAIVFHDKRGDDGELRRHAHAIWCRVDCSKMKAIQLSFSRRRLQSLSRELYLEHGWQMPRGLLQQGFCDPRNFTLEEWQQAKRRKKDPRVLKAIFQDAWAMSDSRDAFANALLEKGFALARGDRRGFVAVDPTGEVYSLSRWTGEKPKDLRGRFGDEGQLPSAEEAQSQIVDLTASRLYRLQEELRAKFEEDRLKRIRTIKNLAFEAIEQMTTLARRHTITLKSMEAKHTNSLRTGLLGLLDRLSGRRRLFVEKNRLERERLRRQQNLERTQLRLRFERERDPLINETKTETLSARANSEVASDIRTMRQLRSALDPGSQPRLKQDIIGSFSQLGQPPMPKRRR
ncbi:MAG: relaxase/mobilization nuclease domain-containing protein [Hyphomicrobiales bacterium]